MDLMWRLLNGAMPVTGNVKQVVLQIGSNNLLKQWVQVGTQLVTGFQEQYSNMYASEFDVQTGCGWYCQIF